jgi:hypothetical protein
MILYLNNWIFFIVCLVVYLIMLIIPLNVCGFFRFLYSLSFVQNITGKINNSKFFVNVKSINSKYIIWSFRIVYGKILNPLIQILTKLIFSVSDGLITFSRITENHISDKLKEGFELLCLLTRKSINAEYKSVWSAILAAIVLIYFILTNV